jgi:isocitrate dehydrogenase
MDRLGQTPTTVAAVPVPEAGGTCFLRPPRPTSQQVIKTFKGMVTQVMGCDIYLDSALPPLSLAEEMQRACVDSPFKLTLISNRGTQVWPTGSVYTECVDYYRVRFEIKEGVAAGSFGQSRAIALLDRIAESYPVSTYELLRTFDGVKGYSMAQGQ